MRKKIEKLEGGIDTDTGIGIKAEEFLKSLVKLNPSDFTSCHAGFRDMIADENDPKGNNHNLLCAAYQLALKKLGLSENSVEEAISLVTKSTKDQISLLGIAEKHIEIEVLNSVQVLVRETIVAILDEELSEDARTTKKQRIMQMKINQTKDVASLKQKQIKKAAIKETIRVDVGEFLSSIKNNADPRLIKVTRLLRSVVDEHTVKMKEDGYVPEVRRQIISY